MTVLPGVPPEVVEFVTEKIDTVPELEALLIMSRDEARCWTIDELAARIYVSKETARAVLDVLLRRRFIAQAGDPQRFCFQPECAEDRLLISRLALAYSTSLIPLTTYVHGKTSAAIREFARAFEMKKDK
jgi:hypothetical protein